MTFFFTYDMEYWRTIPAVLIDARASINEIKNKIGSVIKTYTDAEVAKVTENVLPYKIETINGNLVGYFCLKINNGNAIVNMLQLRQNFEIFNSEIQGEIVNFVNDASNWKKDFLY